MIPKEVKFEPGEEGNGEKSFSITKEFEISIFYLSSKSHFTGSVVGKGRFCKIRKTRRQWYRYTKVDGIHIGRIWLANLDRYLYTMEEIYR